MRVLMIVSLLGAATAVPRSTQRIVGGSSTTIEDYPYMVNMEYGWFGGLIWQQSCGAALLTTRTSVSAAHCYIRDHESIWRSRVGSSYSSRGGTILQLSRIIIHEGYNNFNNDVALIHYATPAVWSATVQSCFIAGSNFTIEDGTEVTSIGWGDLNRDSKQGSEQLQHVTVNIINQRLCAERYAYLKLQPGYDDWPDVTNSMLCAGRLNVGGANACLGDAGGPLAYDGNTVVGITSWGYGCGDAYYPGVNARVSHHSQWIVNNAI